MTDELDLAHWRREVNQLYAEVRAEQDPATAHTRWMAGRERLLLHHAQSPVLPDDPLRKTGAPYWPYDPVLRFELPVRPPQTPAETSLPSGADGDTALRLVGHVDLPPPFGASLDVWWLRQYAGGLFLPLRDGTAGSTTYGGGRYLLDTAKGADLGGTSDRLVVDLNFLYHPSCRYNPAWQCPLAPPGNTIRAGVLAGERL